MNATVPDMPSLLLVEDNMADVLLILRRLRDGSCRIRHVRTAAAALTLLEHERFDAILLDHRLPDMPGTQACRRMREMGMQGPIILLSALADDDLAKQALAAGATDYVVKDIVMPDLGRYLAPRLAGV